MDKMLATLVSFLLIWATVGFLFGIWNLVAWNAEIKMLVIMSIVINRISDSIVEVIREFQDKKGK